MTNRGSGFTHPGRGYRRPGSPREKSPMRRCCSGAGLVGAAGLFWLVMLATSAAGQAPTPPPNTFTVSDSTVMVHIVFSGRVFAFGIDAKSVSNMVCPPGTTANQTGGPGGKPECLSPAGVTDETFTETVNGIPRMTLGTFESLDGRSYVPGPICKLFTAPATPPVVPQPKQQLPGPTISTRTSSSDLTLVWGGTVVVGVGVTGGCFFCHTGKKKKSKKGKAILDSGDNAPEF